MTLLLPLYFFLTVALHDSLISSTCEPFQQAPPHLTCSQPKWSKNGITVAGITGQIGSSSFLLHGPAGLFIDALGNLYVADLYNDRIQLFVKGSKTAITVAGTGGVGISNNQLRYPLDVFVDTDSTSNNLYVADYMNGRIQKWNLNDNTTGTTVIDSNSQFFYPQSVFVTNNNNTKEIFVSGRVEGITYGYGLMKNSTLISTDFIDPQGLFVDKCNNIYVADSGNHCVKKFVSNDDGSFISTIVAGVKGKGLDSSHLNYPNDVIPDRCGNLYIANSENNRIQRISVRDGMATTILGNGEVMINI
jgi:hypothetical protein